MIIVAIRVGAVIGAQVHLLAFVWQPILFRRAGVHRGVFRGPPEDVEPVRLWSFGVAFSGLFLGLRTIAGVALRAAGQVAAGQALVG